MFDCYLEIAHSFCVGFVFHFCCVLYVLTLMEVIIALSATWRKEITEADPPLLPKASVLYYILPKNRGPCGFTL